MSMVKTASWEADSYSTSQEIHHNGTWKLTTIFARAHKSSNFWARWIQSPPVLSWARWIQSPPVLSWARWIQSPPVLSWAWWIKSPPVLSWARWIQSPPVLSWAWWIQSPPVLSWARWIQSLPVLFLQETFWYFPPICAQLLKEGSSFRFSHQDTIGT